ncbi:unnamed protein product, partial [Symbiodinium sp. CCMP2456]
ALGSAGPSSVSLGARSLVASLLAECRSRHVCRGRGGIPGPALVSEGSPSAGGGAGAMSQQAGRWIEARG